MVMGPGALWEGLPDSAMDPSILSTKIGAGSHAEVVTEMVGNSRWNGASAWGRSGNWGG